MPTFSDFTEPILLDSDPRTLPKTVLDPNFKAFAVTVHSDGEDAVDHPGVHTVGTMDAREGEGFAFHFLMDGSGSFQSREYKRCLDTAMGTYRQMRAPVDIKDITSDSMRYLCVGAPNIRILGPLTIDQDLTALKPFIPTVVVDWNIPQALSQTWTVDCVDWEPWGLHTKEVCILCSAESDTKSIDTRALQTTLTQVVRAALSNAGYYYMDPTAPEDSPPVFATACVSIAGLDQLGLSKMAQEGVEKHVYNAVTNGGENGTMSYSPDTFDGFVTMEQMEANRILPWQNGMVPTEVDKGATYSYLQDIPVKTILPGPA